MAEVEDDIMQALVRESTGNVLVSSSLLFLPSRHRDTDHVTDRFSCSVLFKCKGRSHGPLLNAYVSIGSCLGDNGLDAPHLCFFGRTSRTFKPRRDALPA